MKATNTTTTNQSLCKEDLDKLIQEVKDATVYILAHPKHKKRIDQLTINIPLVEVIYGEYIPEDKILYSTGKDLFKVPKPEVTITTIT